MNPIAQDTPTVLDEKPAKKPRPYRFNPLNREFQRNPYPFYDHLRDTDPVHKGFDMWVLTRYHDVKTILRDPRFCADRVPERIENKRQYFEQHGKNIDMLAKMSGKFFFFLDPPDHSRLRRLVGKAFSAKMIEELRPLVHEIVDQLIDKAKPTGTIDIVEDLSCPLPIVTIARMLGVPHHDAYALSHWSNEMARIIDPLMSLEAYEELNQVTIEFTDYFRGLIAERRRSPQDDLISALICARDEGDKLSEDELLSVCMLLFITGEETTVHTVGNGILALLNHPDQLELLKRNPDLIQSAIEELLRYDSPVQQTARIALEDVVIGGQRIKAGENILVSLGSANRDRDRFVDPDRLDITRRDNHHLAFGDGIHYCLGAPLARIQAQIAINAVVQQLPNLQLTDAPLEWRKNINIRGLKSLPVAFTTA